MCTGLGVVGSAATDASTHRRTPLRLKGVIRHEVTIRHCLHFNYPDFIFSAFEESWTTRDWDGA